MIPIRAITSITTRKDGLRNYAVSIITAGTIDMRVLKDEAAQAKNIITRQMPLRPLPPRASATQSTAKPPSARH